MIKYIIFVLVYIIMLIIAALFNPIFVLLRQDSYGRSDNDNKHAIEPRLPKWLAWFDTPDNSLYGDTGWQTIHRTKDWNKYLGMVMWLYRNPCAGFCWSVLAQDVPKGTTFTYTGPIEVDKGQQKWGSLFIKASNGLWQYKCAKLYKGWRFSLELGWLLDRYIKDPKSFETHPKAKLDFQPMIPRPVKTK